MKKILVLALSLFLPVIIYSQECCPVYIDFRGTIEANDLQITRILLPTISTFDTSDSDNLNSSYSDLYIKIKNEEYRSLTSSLGGYCDPFDFNKFILSLKYFHVIIETIDKNGNVNLLKRRFNFSEVVLKTDVYYAIIEIPKIIL